MVAKVNKMAAADKIDRSGGLHYAESDVMTRYDGYWVLRSAVDQLRELQQQLEAGDKLEPLQLRRAMKKHKRTHHRQLVRHLLNEAAMEAEPAAAAAGDNSATVRQTAELQSDDDSRRQSDSDSDNGDKSACSGGGGGAAAVLDRDAVFAITDQLMAQVKEECVSAGKAVAKGGGGRMVMFDGVMMPADAVGRLKQLRAKLRAHHLNTQQQRAVMKAARRREETRHKRLSRRVCLGCRGRGHEVSQCPRLANSNSTSTTTAAAEAAALSVCFRCGSADHRLSRCPVAAARTSSTSSSSLAGGHDGEATGGGKSSLPYASCFVCGERGHLSRDCAQNPRGAYPRGGACRVCGSRCHLASECSEKSGKSGGGVSGDTQSAAKTEGEEASGGGGGGTVRLQMMSVGSIDADYEHDFSDGANNNTNNRSQQQRKSRTVVF